MKSKKKRTNSKVWQLWGNSVSTCILPRTNDPKKLRAIDSNDTLLWTFKAVSLDQAGIKAYAYMARKKIDLTKLKRPTWLKVK